MNCLQIIDEIGLLSAKMEDVRYLMQEIKEEYFEKFDSNKETGREGIAWEYDRYAAFYRFVEEAIFSVSERLSELKGILDLKSEVKA